MPGIAGMIGQEGVGTTGDDGELPCGKRDGGQVIDASWHAVLDMPPRHGQGIGRRIKDLNPLVRFGRRCTAVVEHLGQQDMGDLGRRNESGEIPGQFRSIHHGIGIGTGKRGRTRQEDARLALYIGKIGRGQRVGHNQAGEDPARVADRIGDGERITFRGRRRPRERDTDTRLGNGTSEQDKREDKPQGKSSRIGDFHDSTPPSMKTTFHPTRTHPPEINRRQSRPLLPVADNITRNRQKIEQESG